MFFILRILWSESAADHLFLTLPERESHHILWDGCVEEAILQFELAQGIGGEKPSPNLGRGYFQDYGGIDFVETPENRLPDGQVEIFLAGIVAVHKAKPIYAADRYPITTRKQIKECPRSGDAPYNLLSGAAGGNAEG